MPYVSIGFKLRIELTVGGDGCREGERDLRLILQPLTIENLERLSSAESILNFQQEPVFALHAQLTQWS